MDFENSEEKDGNAMSVLRWSVPLLLAGLLNAQARTQFRVQVDVSAKGALDPELASYITRELRSLPDVVVVSQAPEHRLTVVALEIPSAGYAFSVVATRPVNVESLRDLYSGRIGKRELDELLDDLSGAEFIVDHWVRTGPADLVEASRRITATFDARVLEPRRLGTQGATDELDRLLGKPVPRPTRKKD